MNAPILGIDLGTTFSAAAFIDEKTGLPTAIETADGSTTLASVVEIEAGVVKSVGAPALGKWIADPDRVIRWVKRAMGTPDYRFQGLGPAAISAAILRTLKQDAERRFKIPVRQAVITCPAYFGSVERESTLEAGRLAGLEVQQLIEEPTAAAVHFGINHMHDGERVLVCDLGGGTYDATILLYEKGVFHQIETTGDREMGGHDWTTDLATLVRDRFYDETGLDLRDSLAGHQLLYEECEKAKREFARLPSATVRCACGDQTRDIVVTRDEFESVTEHRMQHLVAITVQVLTKAGLRWTDLQRVLLVGGSCRLRRLGLALEEVSGIKPQASTEPDLSVAYGAACVAAGRVRRKARPDVLLAQNAAPVLVVVERSLARSLGTRTIVWEQGKPRIANALLIPHGTPVPESGLTQSRDDFEISANGQQCIDVPVVEFETDDDFLLRGNYRFTCARPTQRGDRIRVTFRYDKNAIARVEATDVQTGQPLTRTEVAYAEPDLITVVPPRPPRLVVFVIDVSGSMDGHGKLQNAQQGVIQNARMLLGQGTSGSQVAVVSFSDDAELVCPPTGDAAAVERCVQSMKTSGTTVMEKGLDRALAVVRTAPAGADRDIVLVTDGQPDHRQAALDAAQRVRGAGINLCMLGVGHQDVDHAFLKQMSTMTLVIDQTADISASMFTLLTQSASSRPGAS